MAHTLQEISEFAEFIAEENTIRGTISLDKIARKENIAIHYDSFETYFTGMLQYEDGNFDIFVNLDKVKHRKNPRTRFTIAHELGHYYLDNHRNLLKSGYSLSYDKEFTFFSNHLVEKEANFFATNLIMPRSRFISDMNASSIGMRAVKALADKYKTSITATVIQYRNLLSYPAFLMFWAPNREYKRKNFSDSYYNLIKQFSTNFQVSESVQEQIFEGFDNFHYTDITSVNTTLCNLHPEIQSNSKMDMPVTIGTMSLQGYGFVSLAFVTE